MKNKKNVSFLLSLFVLCALFVSNVMAASQDLSKAKAKNFGMQAPPFNLLVIGDSLSSGTQDISKVYHKNSYVDYLQQYFSPIECPVQFIGPDPGSSEVRETQGHRMLGGSGWSMRDVVAGRTLDDKTGSISYLDSPNPKPDAAIIFLGTNDARETTTSFVGPGNAEELSKRKGDLDSIITKLQTRNPSVKILLVGIPIPANITTPSNLWPLNTTADAQKLNEMFDSISNSNVTKLRTSTTNGWGQFARISDNLHPSDVGAKAIASVIATSLKNMNPCLKYSTRSFYYSPLVSSPITVCDINWAGSDFVTVSGSYVICGKWQ